MGKEALGEYEKRCDEQSIGYGKCDAPNPNSHDAGARMRLSPSFRALGPNGLGQHCVPLRGFCGSYRPR